jgi:hypothetical protein
MGLKYHKTLEIKSSTPLPEGESIVICLNRSGEYGPISAIYNYPRAKRIWMNSEFVYARDFSRYVIDNYYSDKSKPLKLFFSIIYTLMSPLVVSGLKSLEVIPVYRDARLKTTLRKTNETLIFGKDVVIFPEYNKPCPDGGSIKRLQKGFVFAAKAYHDETGRRLSFYPAYVSKKKQEIKIGDPIRYNPENEFIKERARITDYIFNEMEKLAKD